MRDQGFLCEHCSDEGYDVPLRESYQQQDGDLVDAQQRAQRVAQAKQMQVSHTTTAVLTARRSICALT